MGNIDKDYLMHHGVKGMKWGVRRYQNPDGSLTDAGRRKYLTESGGLTKAGYKAVKKGVKESERLKRRANLSEQQADVEKYGRRAKTAGKVALGAGATAAAVAYGGGLAIDLATKHVRGKIDSGYRKLDDELSGIIRDSHSRMTRASEMSGAARDKAFDQLQQKVSDRFYEHDNKFAAHKKLSEQRRTQLNTLKNIRNGVAAGAAGVAVGAIGVAAYSKIRQKMAEKNIRDIQSGEAAKRYKEHTQRMINAFGSKTIRDARNFDKKNFNRDLDKLGAAENKVANLESIKNRAYKNDPKNGSYFYDKPIAEAKAARDAQYNKMASNTVAKWNLENKYGYKDGLDTYDKKKKR